MKIFIVIPVFNEGQRGLDTLEKVLKKSKNQIIIVDDGSDDSFVKTLNKKLKRNRRIITLRHIINLGKGAAMKTGAEMAFNLGGEAVIFLDSDGQHNPDHLKEFEKYLLKHKIVFGYRLMNEKMPLIRKYGNIIALNIVRLLFNIKKKDLLSGYMGFRREVYTKLLWKSSRYGIETEMATRVGKNKIPYKEIEIDTIYIDKYKGVSILDAFKILFQIPFWYFSK